MQLQNHEESINLFLLGNQENKYALSQLTPVAGHKGEQPWRVRQDCLIEDSDTGYGEAMVSKSIAWANLGAWSSKDPEPLGCYF